MAVAYGLVCRSGVLRAFDFFRITLLPSLHSVQNFVICREEIRVMHSSFEQAIRSSHEVIGAAIEVHRVIGPNQMNEDLNRRKRREEERVIR